MTVLQFIWAVSGSLDSRQAGWVCPNVVFHQHSFERLCVIGHQSLDAKGDELIHGIRVVYSPDMGLYVEPFHGRQKPRINNGDTAGLNRNLRAETPNFGCWNSIAFEPGPENFPGRKPRANFR